eukprot:g13709.t1
MEGAGDDFGFLLPGLLEGSGGGCLRLRRGTAEGGTKNTSGGQGLASDLTSLSSKPKRERMLVERDVRRCIASIMSELFLEMSSPKASAFFSKKRF